ncbi:MAG: YXWGXW repeat-containing protein [Gemmatimonadetes bacterium]|nr:YXWGXW repeat-containing protein [Gemmatimonadota bacterium]
MHNQSIARVARVTVAALGLFWLTACPGPVYLQVGPPPAPVEVISPRPGEYFVWIEGSWLWDDQVYVWSPGRWVRAPRPEAVWVPGSWRQSSMGWFWVPGRWK